MTEALELARELVLPAVQLLALLLGAWLLRRVLHRVVQGAVERTLERRAGSPGVTANAERVLTLVAVARSSITAMITAMVAISALSRLGVDTAPLLTGAGILGVAIGLGTQHLVRDIVAGIILLLENQFNVGDDVSAAGIDGRVENVTLRCLYLRDAGGTLWAIPSGDIRQLGNRDRHAAERA